MYQFIDECRFKNSAFCLIADGKVFQDKETSGRQYIASDGLKSKTEEKILKDRHFTVDRYTF